MNSVLKIAGCIGLLAALAGGAVYLLQPDDAVVAPPPSVNDEPVEPKSPDVPKDITSGPVQTAQPGPGDRQLVDTTTHKDLPQGVTGRVLTSSGTPCANAQVFLMPGAMANALQTFLDLQSGRVAKPTAQGLTGEDGRFRLGTDKIDVVHDLRVVTDEFAELAHRSFKIRTGEWYDTGDLQLQAGVVVHGRVTREGSLAAVPDALVYLQSSNDSHTLQPLPGREKGMAARTDAGGAYHFHNAPRDTTVKLTAEAEGFAKVEKLNLVLQQETANECNIELAPGMALGGHVRDASGAAVANAQVNVMAISTKLPQVAQGRTDSQGRFDVQGLREGPYQIDVTADLYAQKSERPVFAGTTDLAIVLESRGMARVKVLARNGAPIKDFTLSLKSFFPNNPMGTGNVLEFKNRRVSPADFKGDSVAINGIPNGQFKFQIAAANHARTLSEPFSIVAGGDVPVVTVTMSLGGVITGRVIDDRGQPVADAAVATDMNGAAQLQGTALWEIFGQLAPDQVTKASTRSGQDGTFRLPLLAYGDYMITAAHGAFCESTAADLKVVADTDLKVPDLVLQRGTLVHGNCTIAGQPAAQVKVVIAAQENAMAMQPPQGTPAKAMFNASALTDNDGNFRFSKRVPPGTWRIHASRQAGNGDIFKPLLDMKETGRDLVVLPGQDQLLQQFQFTDR